MNSTSSPTKIVKFIPNPRVIISNSQFTSVSEALIELVDNAVQVIYNYFKIVIMPIIHNAYNINTTLTDQLV